MRRVLSGALALSLWLFAAAQAAPVRSPHLTAELVSQTDGVAPGSTVYVAVVQTLAPGWHTYWRNPGDAGEATRLQWGLPAGWRAGDIVWPAPSRFVLGPLMNYGYAARAVLAVPITAPATAVVGQVVNVQTRMDFLVCADVCVPGTLTLATSLPVVSGTPPRDPVWGGPISEALSAAPKLDGVTASFRLTGRQLQLSVVGPALAGGRVREAYFYPYDDKLIDQAAPERVDLGTRGLTLDLAAGEEGRASPPPSQASGVLVADGRAFEVAAEPGPAPAGAGGLGAPKVASAPGSGLAAAVALAFAGGLLLNLMPCVFPVLSMKAAALARHGGAPAKARIEGVAFLVGVLASFLVLDGAMIAARGAGAALGWGFQLQSPLVVSLLCLVMLAAALNLFGVFEFGSSLQGLGGDVRPTGGVAGALFTGVLAVVVAAPCTAPFMGPALGWALTAPAPASLTVFTGLALGFAAPFVALAFSPGLLRRLPRPGPWTDGLRKLLAFPMFGAAAWLAWVLSLQTGSAGLARLFTAALALSFSAWLWGIVQQRRLRGQRTVAIFVAALAGLALTSAMAASAGESAPPSTGPTSSRSANAADLPVEPFDPQRLAALRAEGRPVLVNFTAAWCVTCQVNERTVFSSGRVAQAFRHAGARYMVADWTSRDPVIARALAAQGRIGVPLYLVYGADGGEPRILPQLLTPGLVADALQAAARSGPRSNG